jgi:hypothetical protein
MFVFSQEIMHHPDFNMTPCAGTSFNSESVYLSRPWSKDLGVEKVELFHKSKLHPMVEGWSVSFFSLLYGCSDN